MDGHGRDSHHPVRRRSTGGPSNPDKEVANQGGGRQTTGDAPQPPALAELLLQFLPARVRDAVIGDLYEDFQENLTKHGLRRARRLYWHEVLRSVGPLILRAAAMLLTGLIGRPLF
jgi:hypothetical protein